VGGDAGQAGLLTEQFEPHRARLRGVAHRILGSVDEADDAVQETWLRLQRSGADGVDNLGGWLTTVVGRVCLDMLRRRRTRRETSLELHPSDPAGGQEPEREAVLAESVGHALLVLLDTLTPPERIAYVLHDLFAVPFDEVAAVLDHRSAAAARQLASRARRRLQGMTADGADPADARRRHEVVEAFLAAARQGDFTKLLAVLDPDVVLRADATVPDLGGLQQLRGREAVAHAFLGKAQAARVALLDAAVGAVFMPDGQLRGVLEFVVPGNRITAIEIVSDAHALQALDVVLLDL
jgi:RNA polymerase sigma factor (sigma-70 family)